jgi:hypothetical protein
MSGTSSSLVAALEELEPSGEWVRYTPSEVERRPELAQLVAAFQPLDYPAGHAAQHFVQNEALDNHGSTVTHLLVGLDRVEGFIATNFTEVMLTPEQSGTLDLPHRTRLPAFRVAWVAKHRETAASGLELMAAAYAMAEESLAYGGVVALVVDPYDAALAEKWKAEPYYFEESKERTRDGVPRKLWTPIQRDRL